MRARSDIFFNQQNQGQRAILVKIKAWDVHNLP